MSGLGNRTFQGQGLKPDVARRLDDLARAVTAVEEKAKTAQTTAVAAVVKATTSSVVPAQTTEVINVTNSTGGSSSAPPAAIPKVSSPPAAATTLAFEGSLIDINGFLYRYNSVTNVWETADLLIEDTHANRSTYTASSYPINALYFETDRTVFYVNRAAGWTYLSGIMVGATAALPAGLGSADAGFLFVDSTLEILEQWSGAAWVTIITSTPTSPAWTGFSPTLTLSAGTATISANNCKYSQSGKRIFVRGHLTFTVSLAATYGTIALPVAALDNNQTLAVSLFVSSTVTPCACQFVTGARVFATLAITTTYDLFFEGVYESS